MLEVNVLRRKLEDSGFANLRRTLMLRLLSLLMPPIAFDARPSTCTPSRPLAVTINNQRPRDLASAPQYLLLNGDVGTVSLANRPASLAALPTRVGEGTEAGDGGDGSRAGDCVRAGM